MFLMITQDLIFLQNSPVDDFTTSWDDGQAFCNIMHHYEDDKVPVNKLNSSSKRANLMVAFQIARYV